MREGKKKKKKPSITNFLHSDWFQKEKEKKKKSWVKSQFPKSMTYVEFEQQGVYSCLKKHPNTGQEATGVHSPRHRGRLRCYGNHQATFSPFP